MIEYLSVNPTNKIKGLASINKPIHSLLYLELILKNYKLGPHWIRAPLGLLIPPLRPD